MNIKLTGMSQEILAGAQELATQLGFKIDENGEQIKLGRCEKGFSISVSNNSAEILYERPTDFYRALAITVDALKNKEEKQLRQSYSFNSCGIMIDLSRRAVLKVETVKKIIRYMACMGLNRLGLYTEDTYEIEGYPYFGYMRGRYTKEEIKEIVRYGNVFNIETIPYIQTLAHLERALKWSVFGDVRDSWDSLLVGEDKTYELIEAMIKTVRECYTTDKIHIGMDEAYSVGVGNYLTRNGYRNKTEIILEHLQKVVSIADRYGMKPIMWGDMFFNEVRRAPDDSDNIAKIIKGIPKGVELVLWSYGGRSEKLYDEYFGYMEKLNTPVSFTGGMCTWLGPGVNYTMSFEASLAGLRTAKRYGISDVMVSLWGDGGAECDYFASMLGWQYYAEFNYNGEFKRADDLYEMFRVCTGMDGRAFLLFDCDNYYKQECPAEAEVIERASQPTVTHAISRQVLYQNPIMGLFDKNMESLELRRHYGELREKFAQTSAPTGFESLFESYAQTLKVMEKKCDIGNRLIEAYKSKDTERLCALKDDLDHLALEINTMYELRSRLWHENNKPFGFEEIGNRMMSVMGMTRNASKRLEAFLNREIDTLPELEVERLPYNPNEFPLTIEWNMNNIPMP